MIGFLFHFLSENYTSGKLQIRHKSEGKIEAEKSGAGHREDFMLARIVKGINKAFQVYQEEGNTRNGNRCVKSRRLKHEIITKWLGDLMSF